MSDDERDDDRGPPYVRGSATSLSGAQAIKPHRRTQARVLFDRIAEEPTTCDNIVRTMLDDRGEPFKHQSVTPRLFELKSAHCIRESGETRPTAAAEAVVYEVVPGATFELYDQYMRQKQREQRRATMKELKQAAQAWARAKRQGAPKEERQRCGQALLDVAERMFPDG